MPSSQSVTKTAEHTDLTKSILKAMLYFDIFKYPLTATEIFQHLTTNHVTQENVETELNNLCNQSIIYPVLNFYSIHNDNALASRRVMGNQMAAHSLSLAQKKALHISKFPFVRAVMASGSLSKGYMDESSDLDFFVITQPGRLWIARFLLVLYKKIFLFNSHKYFCINYFVDESHLDIEEKNLFTATELATLIPLYGKEYYSLLISANRWMNMYLPNHTPRSTENVSAYHPGWLKRTTEKLINLAWANKIESACMQLLSSRWKQRYQPIYSKADFEIAFKTKKYVSKGHPNNHQRKVLDMYHQKLEEFGNKLSIDWND